MTTLTDVSIACISEQLQNVITSCNISANRIIQFHDLYGSTAAGSIANKSATSTAAASFNPDVVDRLLTTSTQLTDLSDVLAAANAPAEQVRLYGQISQVATDALEQVQLLDEAMRTNKRKSSTEKAVPVQAAVSTRHRRTPSSGLRNVVTAPTEVSQTSMKL